jgi:hypothetical protein
MVHLNKGIVPYCAHHHHLSIDVLYQIEIGHDLTKIKYVELQIVTLSPQTYHFQRCIFSTG